MAQRMSSQRQQWEEDGGSTSGLPANSRIERPPGALALAALILMAVLGTELIGVSIDQRGQDSESTP